MLLIYSPVTGPRLDYIVGELFNRWYGCSARITHDPEEYRQHNGAGINYSRIPIQQGEIRIQPAGILEETGIPLAKPPFSGYGKDTILFPSTAADTYPFDLLSAAFWLMSRAEEYHPFTEDQFGRFPASQSFAQQNGFLEYPLIQVWMTQLLNTICKDFPDFQFSHPETSFQTTIDIDQAFAFKYRGAFQQLLTAGNSLVRGRFWSIGEQIKTILGGKDPYDSFDYLRKKEEELNTHFLYFFLLTENRSKYDPNLPPTTHTIRELLHTCASTYKAGLHPSFLATNSPSIIGKEKDSFKDICGSEPTKVRQHYIRLKLPATYQNYEQQGFTEDYSMGYPETAGFRASTSIPFYWFDLQENKPTALLLFPFCLMEGNFEEEGPNRFTQNLRQLHSEVLRYGGNFIQIWHNHTITNKGPWKGWKPAFEESLKLLHSKA